MRSIVNNIILLLLALFLVGCANEKQAILKGIKNTNSKEALDSIVNSLDDRSLQDDILIAALLQKYEKIGITDQSEIRKTGLKLGSPVYLNVIIIPDLSNRLNMLGTQSQSESDIKIILNVYDKFIDRVNMSRNTDIKDCFKIDLTQETQSIGKPINVNLSNGFNKDKIANEKSNLKKKLEELYANAADNKIEGNDYVSYFKNQLVEPKLKRSSLNEVWENKVIILTDGYLETGSINYTPINVSSSKQPIKEIGIKNVKFDVSLVEIHLRKGDEGKNDNLRNYWYNWFKSMGVANIDYSDWWLLKDNTGNLDNINESLGQFMSLKPIIPEKKTSINSETIKNENIIESQEQNHSPNDIDKKSNIASDDSIKNLASDKGSARSSINNDPIAKESRAQIEKSKEVKVKNISTMKKSSQKSSNDINDKLKKIYKDIEEEERNSSIKESKYEGSLK
jgi:hypothetical protein